PQSGRMTDADQHEFDRFVDRLSVQDASDREWLGNTSREPGEEGFASPATLQHLGGAVAGGLAGAASGDDTQDRIKRGVIGATVGAMVPSLVGRNGARVAPRVAGLAERTAAARITPDTIDPRLGGQAPPSGARPSFGNPQDAVYARVLE